MKNQLKKLIEQALLDLIANGVFPKFELPEIQIARTKDKAYGDFSCNVAMMLARTVKTDPCQIATQIVGAIADTGFISKIDIAGQGFINFTLSAKSAQQIVKEVLAAGAGFGSSKIGAGKRVQVEFVSANPTGPLHVGHGRGAAYGSVVSSLLKETGFAVSCEYYVNDAGRQMDILASSVWLRYLSACGKQITFPDNGYKGDYVLDIAASLKDAVADKLVKASDKVFDSLPADEHDGGDKEQYIDALISNAKTILGKTDYQKILDFGLNSIIAGIKTDLAAFGTEYDEWFSERSLMRSGEVDRAVAQLKESNDLEERAGAWWFKSSNYGDEKDRVVVRDNGQTTYFASDIAYHLNKFKRGFDTVINVWGSDHHGYILRVKTALTAMKQDQERLKVLLVQFATLYRGTEKVAMSTRSGQFVTLKELTEEAGKDAARFFYVMRSVDQHMDFDLELAKSQSNDNPVYYVQYAHARVCSVFSKLAERDLIWDKTQGENKVHRLMEDHEQALFTALSRYPEIIETAALNYAPHILAHYLMDLARDFHAYYNAHNFIVDDHDLSQARLTLISAVKQVISNGLTVMGVSAPEQM